MNQALDLFPSDYWRWWLLSHAPETSDADFTWKSFQSCVNKDLADILGNFVSRLTKFTLSKFGEAIPKGTQYGQEELDTILEIGNILKNYDYAMTKIEIRKAASCLRKIWSIGNEYLQRSQPWVVIKTNEAEAAKNIRFGFNLMLFFSEISSPFIPETAYKIKSCLGKSYEKGQWPSSEKNFASAFEKVKVGAKVSPMENLFKKIEDNYVLELEKQFGGRED